ncbi:MAG: sulfotransferase domain-containing protein, partial [Proteobacteria bacterium]|nr:sulfotransferase domain-containing protein [Pseudomonadota bacterium]
RYEDMLRDTRKTFAGVIGFLGLDVPPARLGAALRNSSFKTLAQQEKQRGFRERSGRTDRFFRKGVAGAWRADLEPSLARAIEQRHRVQMQRFGYLRNDETAVA